MPKAFYPFQKERFPEAIKKKHLPLFWRMRLGKTLLTIRWAEHWKPNFVLVIAPLSVIASWEEELDDEGIDYATMTGTVTERQDAYINGAARGARWFLINYEGMYAREPYINDEGNAGYEVVPNGMFDQDWDVVILDESTRIRNPRANITKDCCERFHDIPHKAILSGSPNPESDMDFFMQFVFLYGQCMGIGNYWTAQDQWTIEAGYDRILKRDVRKELREHVYAKAMVLTQKDVGLGSRLIRETRRVNLPPKAMKAYADIEQQFAFGDLMVKHTITQRNLLHQISGGYKFPEADGRHEKKTQELFNVLDEMRGEKVIVMFRYNAEIDGVAEALDSRKKFKRPYRVITGNTPRLERKKHVQWARKTRDSVLLLQTRCIQYGIDLSFSSTVVRFSRYWDGEVNIQSTERTEHPTRKEPRLEVDIVASGTIDEDLALAVREKRYTVESFMKRLSQKLRKQINERNKTCTKTNSRKKKSTKRSAR